MKKETLEEAAISRQLHNCKAGDDIEVDRYGIAIDRCWENESDNKLWVGNGEYENTVNYCPFCGYKGNDR